MVVAYHRPIVVVLTEKLQQRAGELYPLAYISPRIGAAMHPAGGRLPGSPHESRYLSGVTYTNG